MQHPEVVGVTVLVLALAGVTAVRHATRPPAPPASIAPTPADSHPQHASSPLSYRAVGPSAALNKDALTARLGEVATGASAWTAADAELWASQRAFAETIDAWYAGGASHTMAELKRLCRWVDPPPPANDSPHAALAFVREAMERPFPDVALAKKGAELMIVRLYELSARGPSAGHLWLTRAALAYLRDLERGFGAGVTLIGVMIRAHLERLLMKHLLAHMRHPGAAAQAAQYLQTLEAYAADAMPSLAAIEEKLRARSMPAVVAAALDDGRLARRDAVTALGTEIVDGLVNSVSSYGAELRCVVRELCADGWRQPALAAAQRNSEALLVGAGVPTFKAAAERLAVARWHRYGTELVLRLLRYRAANGRYPAWIEDLEADGAPLPKQPGTNERYEYHFLSGDRFEMPSSRAVRGTGSLW